MTLRHRGARALVLVTILPALFGVLKLRPSAASVPDDARELPGNGSVAVELRADDEPAFFRVTVPPSATSMRLWTEGATADVEMWASFGHAPDVDAGSYDLTTDDTWLDEDLLVDVTDYVPLAPGSWFVELRASGHDLRDGDDRVVRCTLHCALIVPAPRPLALGQAVEVEVTREQGLRAAFDVKVPEELVQRDARLRIEVLSMQADANLLVGPEDPDRTVADAWHVSDTDLGFERLVLPARELAPGFDLHAYASPELDPLQRVHLSVLAVEDAPGAPTLCPPPRIPAPVPDASPLERALSATVGVYGPLGAGSGVVVSPQGLVLTNAHVVVGGADRGDDLVELAVGFDLDRRTPPAPTIGAHVVQYRQDLDLALLRLDTDLDGNPLPADTTFPFLPLRPADAPLSIGDELWCVGFPMTGGSGSFVTVTATHGVLSGFSHELEGVQYKVDAALHSGMSGGACIDAQGRLVGLPSASLSDANEAGGLGFVIPLDLVPRDWLARSPR